MDREAKSSLLGYGDAITDRGNGEKVGAFPDLLCLEWRLPPGASPPAVKENLSPHPAPGLRPVRGAFGAGRVRDFPRRIRCLDDMQTAIVYPKQGQKASNNRTET